MRVLPIIVLSLLLAGAVVLLRKKGQKRLILLFLVGIILLELLLVGARNYLISYKTPQEAYESAFFGRGDIQAVLVGEKTALVVGVEQDDILFTIVERTEKGWRIGNPFRTEAEPLLLDGAESSIISIYHKSGFPDYYVWVTVFQEGEHEVFDNCNSEFRLIRMSEPEIYCAWACEWKEDYIITVDGHSSRQGDAASVLPDPAQLNP